MTGDTWNPGQYERFRAERRQPFVDLTALVRPKPGMRVVDLGCGTGELTRELHRQLGARETLGIDSSDAMLEKSRGPAAEGVRFEKRDIAAFSAPGAYDLVFSNAALHWVPDHEALLARLTAALAADGQIAIQVPVNSDHPSHVVAASVAGETPFREALGGFVVRSPVLPPEAYASLLHRLGYVDQHVRLQVYGHRLAAAEDVVEWVKGTLLTDYERHLTPELFSLFVGRYRARLLSQIGDARPYFFTFKRLLFWGLRQD